MTPEEYQELQELRAYKASVESSRVDRACMRLEELLQSGHDPVMSRRSFSYLVEAILALQEEIRK